MAYKTYFRPINKNKYMGNIDDIHCRSLWERRFCKYLDENKNITKWGFELIKIPYISTTLLANIHRPNKADNLQTNRNLSRIFGLS